MAVPVELIEAQQNHGPSSPAEFEFADYEPGDLLVGVLWGAPTAGAPAGWTLTQIEAAGLPSSWGERGRGGWLMWRIADTSHPGLHVVTLATGGTATGWTTLAGTLRGQARGAFGDFSGLGDGTWIPNSPHDTSQTVPPFTVGPATTNLLVMAFGRNSGNPGTDDYTQLDSGVGYLVGAGSWSPPACVWNVNIAPGGTTSAWTFTGSVAMIGVYVVEWSIDPEGGWTMGYMAIG